MPPRISNLVLACLLLAAPAPEPAPEPAKDPALLLSESFDDANLNKRGWYDGSRFRLSKEARLGDACLEYDWPDRDTQAAKGSSIARHLITPTDEVHLRFYLRLSDDFAWTRKNFHPHLVHFLTTENDKFMGPAATHLTLYVEPVDGKLSLRTQDIQNKDAPHGLTQGPLRGGYNGQAFNSRDILFKDDQWHCIEAQFKLNTLDLKNDKPNADGIVRGWFDGQLVIEHTNVIFRSTDFPNMKFNQFLIAPYFGQGLLPKPQKLWIDELVISRERMGSLEKE